MPGRDWYDVPSHVQRTWPVPVFIDNDAGDMALEEQHIHLRGVDDLIFIKVLANGGAAIITGPAAARRPGHRRDISHVCVARADGFICCCGNEGCLRRRAVRWRTAEGGASRGESTAGAVDLARNGDLGTIQVGPSGPSQHRRGPPNDGQPRQPLRRAPRPPPRGRVRAL